MANAWEIGNPGDVLLFAPGDGEILLEGGAVEARSAPTGPILGMELAESGKQNERSY
jgi:hypothetical protein